MKYGIWSISPLKCFNCRAVAVRLFITCWLVFVLHFATNIVREIYPALSLGDHCSFDISEYVGLHPDIFEIPGRGAFINNNPGASILAAIPYSMARPIIEFVSDRVQEKRAASPVPIKREYKVDNQPNSRKFYYEAVSLLRSSDTPC